MDNEILDPLWDLYQRIYTVTNQHTGYKLHTDGNVDTVDVQLDG